MIAEGPSAPQIAKRIHQPDDREDAPPHAVREARRLGPGAAVAEGMRRGLLE